MMSLLICLLISLHRLQDYGVSDIDPKSATLRKTKKGASSRMSDGADLATRFNALRFLAENLKAQNMNDVIPP